MKTFALTFLAASVLSIATVGSAHAFNASLAEKVLEGRPSIQTGDTSNPTARPDNNGGLQRKAMVDHPGTSGGRTVNPIARVDADSLHSVIRLN